MTASECIDDQFGMASACHGYEDFQSHPAKLFAKQASLQLGAELRASTRCAVLHA